MPTTIAFGDKRAQKKWSGSLFIQTARQSYFNNRFIGESPDSLIQRLTDLEKDAGDTITFDLSVQLRGRPTYGDDRLQGKEENLKFFSDELKIDQMRKAVSAGGKMSRKRTIHNIRRVARDRLAEYWSKFFDQMIFIYLSGARGMNENFIEDQNWAGHAENPIQSPDNDHILYGGGATSKSTIDDTCGMTRDLIESAEVKASMMAATDQKSAQMLPLNIDGEKHYVCLMSKYQMHDLRTKDKTGWLDIQKALATFEGRKSPLCKGGAGMIKNVVLHEHEDVIRFKNYGGDEKQPAARALFMGRQAGVVAYGSTGGFRCQWEETTQDYGNEPTIAGGMISGVKKSRFNDRDFGVLAIDTYAKDPNAKAAA
ncbi:N4-gp56 family major capsid protein [Breoghania corrubedonensis]|uniref:N4-gp56 family major capsid protein n=1 Tax=Breoghania corrubedonensis TaxID=665038 RepID=A0A2T5UPZ6_9HYPH|nr:N4-gp56 family major capsid protein [Breoghania corrubedonensis]PTW53579.1 N4-gp56 family major capsid protein [Breoghania corrubedonensis]